MDFASKRSLLNGNLGKTFYVLFIPFWEETIEI